MKKYLSSYWVRSAFYTFLQRFSITLFGFANFIILIRSLNKEQMGIWALFLTFTSVFESTKTGLLKNAHIMYVSSSSDTEEKCRIASASMLINAGITVVFSLLLLFLAPAAASWLNAGRELATMLQWFIPGLAFMVFFSHFEAVQQSFLDFKGVFAGYFVRQLLFFSVILGHTLFHIPFTLTHLALYQAGCILVGTGVIYMYTRRYLHYRFNPNRASISRVLGYGKWIFGSGLVANLFASLDQLMSARFISTGSVAYYNAASRINALVDIPSYAAAEVLFPKASQANAEEGTARVKYLYERMVAVLLCLTVPAALFIIAFPKLVIGIIAGTAYLAAAPILQLYMVTGVLRPMQNQAANLLNSIGKPSLCFVINTISLIVNLGVNYICLREFGFYGAAIGTLITYMIGATIWYFVMRRIIDLQVGNIIGHMGSTYRMLFTAITKRRGPAHIAPDPMVRHSEQVED